LFEEEGEENVKGSNLLGNGGPRGSTFIIAA